MCNCNNNSGNISFPPPPPFSHGNSGKNYTGQCCGEIKTTKKDTNRIIDATNNKAKYYSEVAEKHKDDAKSYSELAKYYAEQNSDVTQNYVNNVKSELTNLIDTKQPIGDYALKSEVPVNVSELVNDSEYATKNELEDSILTAVPALEGQEKKYLCNNGVETYWQAINSFNLFDTKLSDRILEGDEALGWALQGTTVTKAVYPDFYAKCLEEKESATATEVTLGDSTITMYIHANGHQFYDIADKEIVDTWFNTYGYAWFYGVDSENENVFLPRKKMWDAHPQETLPVVGNGLALGLTTGTEDIALACLSDGITRSNGAGEPYGTSWSQPKGDLSKTYGVIEDPEMSGLITNSQDLFTENESAHLYICVGNTVVNESLVDVGNLTSQINLLDSDKVNTDMSNCLKPYVTETYQSGNSWYCVWSNGWCEQGGILDTSAISAAGFQSISLLKPYANNNYAVIANVLGSTTTYYNVKVGDSTMNTESVVKIAISNAAGGLCWECKGYIA